MCPRRRNADLQMLWNHTASSSHTPSRLQQAFQVLDRDGDGEIRSADLSSFFASFVGQAISDEEVKSMIAMADLDGDGAVGLEEFQRLLNLGAPGGAHERAEDGLLREAFRVLDVNQDGLLSREDLKSAMAMFGQALSEEDLDAMVAVAAGQAAGPSSGSTCHTTIDFDSFSKLMTASL